MLAPGEPQISNQEIGVVNEYLKRLAIGSVFLVVGKLLGQFDSFFELLANTVP
jgi:hypothetical protein